MKSSNNLKMAGQGRDPQQQTQGSHQPDSSQMAPDDNQGQLAQADAGNIAATVASQKPAEAMQVDYQAAAPANNAGLSESIPDAPGYDQAKKVIAMQAAVSTSQKPQASDTAPAPLAPNASAPEPSIPQVPQVQFVTQTDENSKERRQGVAQNLKKMELTAQNIEAHQQQLIQQDTTSAGNGSKAIPTASMPNQPHAVNNAGQTASGTNGAAQKASKDGAPNSGQQQAPSITLQARSATSNPGPGRPSGSTNANRKQKQAAAAKAAAVEAQAAAQTQQTQQSQQPASLDPQQQQQQQQQQHQQQQHQQQQMHAEAYARQKFMQQMQQSQQQQQQRGSQRMTPQEQYMNYQREQQYLQQKQQQQQAHGMPPGSVQQAAQMSQDLKNSHQQQLAMQHAQLHHQQSFASQSSHVHHHHAAAHQSQAVAYQQAAAHQQHTSQSQNYSVLKQMIFRRMSENLRDNSNMLQSADKQHAENLAKQIKKEELNFFLKTDDTRHNKQSLLEQKNQRMDEYISLCAENGGRIIPKQPEPIEPPRETPLVVEARILHMDFVEEAYWKRVQAKLIAQDCRIVALRKAQQREHRRREQARLLQIEEQRRKEEELEKQQNEGAVAATMQNQTPNAAGVQGVADLVGGLNNANLDDGILPQESMVIDSAAKDLVVNEGQEGMLDFMGGENDFPALDAGYDGFQNDFADFGGLDDLEPFHQDNDIPGSGRNQMDDDENQEDDEQFDPEAMIIQQEQRLEQQRMQEESKKQEEEKLQKIAQIENQVNVDDAGDSSHHSNLPIDREMRVQTDLFEDAELDEDKDEQLAALEAEIIGLDLTYLKPASDLRERQLKGGIAPQVSADDPMNQNEGFLPEESKRQATSSLYHHSKNHIEHARSAIKQKFDRLGQLVLEKGHHDEEERQQQQIITHERNERTDRDMHGAIQDRLTTLLQGDEQIGLYVMPGMEDFEFDSENEAIDLDCYEDGDEEKIDMDRFFTDNNHHEFASQEKKKKTNSMMRKIRAPTTLGDEQIKLYRELKEISELAPERNDLAHMKHLYQLWIVKEQEEIQDKKYIKEIFEQNLRFLENKELDKKGRLDKQQIIESIRQYKMTIEAKQNHLEKNKKPQFQPVELHRERFLLTGSDHPQSQQQNLAPQEFSFIKWYYGLFPDQWRLIADIINYHPLTRGPLHCKEWMAREFFNRLDQPHRDQLISRQKIQMQPWRETKLPWLINGREGCLMNSMTYLNKSHLQSIHKVCRIALRARKEQKQVYKFSLNAQGQLQLEKVAGEQPVEVPKNGQEAQAVVSAELAGVKRTRSGMVEMEDHEESETWEDGDYPENLADGRHYSDTQIQERLLNQMLARRRKIDEENNQVENQSNSDALKLGAPGSETIQIDVYAESPFLKELMMDITYKRKKTDEQSNTMAVTVPASTAKEQAFVAFAYDPVNTVKDELDTNTPMWYALQNQNNCQTTIRVQHSTMFWLGYFIRRIMHEENLEKNKSYNFDKLPLWESENEIKNYFINQAKAIRQEQLKIKQMSKNDKAPALITDYSFQQNEKDKEEQLKLQKEIQHFVRSAQQSTSRDEVKQVNDLWEGKQPYYYDKEHKSEYIKQEKDCDQRITNVMYQKSRQLWDEIQFYWFQVNKNLHPRYRKEVNTMSEQQQQQHQQQLQQQQHQQQQAALQMQQRMAQGQPTVMDQQQIAMMNAASGHSSAVMMANAQNPQLAHQQQQHHQQQQRMAQGQQQMVGHGSYPVGVNPGQMGPQMAPGAPMLNSASSSAQQQYAAAAAAAQGRMPASSSSQAAMVQAQQNGNSAIGTQGSSQQRRQQYQHPGVHSQQSNPGVASQYLLSQGPQAPGSQGSMPSQQQQQQQNQQQPTQADLALMSQRAASQAAAASNLAAATASGSTQQQSMQQPGLE